MQMDKSEILTSYKLAKEKGKQLQILAELNDCNKLAIVRILIEGGFDPRGFNKVLSKKEREQMEAEEKKNIEEKAVQAELDPEESTVHEPEIKKIAIAEIKPYDIVDDLKERNKNLVGLNDELIEENRKLRNKNYELKKENKEIKAYWQNRCSQCTEGAVSELATVQLRAEKLHIKLQEAEERIHKLEQGIIKMVIE